MTLMMRPSVPSPTGTAMGWPVSETSCPRTRPSLVSMAMVRTVDSPRCWATSSTRRLPWFLVSSALRIAGRWPSNCTSTTAPMTWVMCPTGLAMDGPWLSRRHMGLPRRSHRLGAGDDLDQLLGDHRLAGAVVGQRLFADHLAGIAGGVVHRAHLRAVERGGVLEQRAEDLHRDVARQQLGQDFLLLRLVLVAGAIAGLTLEDRGSDLGLGRKLRDHGFERGVEQHADVERAVGVEPQDLVGNVLGVLEGERAYRTQLDVLDDLLLILAAQLLVALAADAEELDLLAFAGQRGGALARQPHDRRIERPTQAALGGADHEQPHAVAAGAGEEPGRRAEVADRGGDVAEHLAHVVGI